jgi:hypothetical protein
LGGGNFAGKLVTTGKRMLFWNFFAGVKSAESLLYLPEMLPLGFDQMKWILPAAARHRARILRKEKQWGNRGVDIMRFDRAAWKA